MRRYRLITILFLLAVILNGTAIGQHSVTKFSFSGGAVQVYPYGGEMRKRFDPSSISFNVSLGYVLSDKAQVILAFEYAKLKTADDLKDDLLAGILDKNEFTFMPLLVQFRYYPIGVGTLISPFISIGAGCIVWENKREGPTTYVPSLWRPSNISHVRKDYSMGYSAGLGLSNTYRFNSFIKAISIEVTAEFMAILDDLFGAEMYGFYHLFPVPLTSYNVGLRFYL